VAVEQAALPDAVLGAVVARDASPEQAALPNAAVGRAGLPDGLAVRDAAPEPDGPQGAPPAQGAAERWEWVPAGLAARDAGALQAGFLADELLADELLADELDVPGQPEVLLVARGLGLDALPVAGLPLASPQPGDAQPEPCTTLRADAKPQVPTAEPGLPLQTAPDR
jgi:hypothetical protein